MPNQASFVMWAIKSLWALFMRISSGKKYPNIATWVRCTKLCVKIVVLPFVFLGPVIPIFLTCCSCSILLFTHPFV